MRIIPEKIFIRLKLMTLREVNKRVALLKQKNMFCGMVEHYYWHPTNIPSEPI